MSKSLGKLCVELSDPRRLREPIDTSIFSGDTRSEQIDIIKIFQDFHDMLEGVFEATPDLNLMEEQIVGFNNEATRQTVLSAETDTELKSKIKVVTLGQTDSNTFYEYFVRKLKTSTIVILKFAHLIFRMRNQEQIPAQEKEAKFRRVINNQKTIKGISSMGYAIQGVIVPALQNTSDEQNRINIEYFKLENDTLRLSPEGEQVNLMHNVPPNDKKYKGCTATYVSHPIDNNLVSAHTRWTLEILEQYWVRNWD